MKYLISLIHCVDEMKNAQLKEELKKVSEENQRLKEMLSQTTNDFNSLQMQLVSVMRQQEDHHHLVINQHSIILIFNFCVLSIYL